MRTIAAVGLGCLLLLAWTNNANPATPQVVYVQNFSSRLSDSAIQDALPAFQASVSYELQRYWHVNATLVLVPSDATPPDGATHVTLEDYSDNQFAEAYHTLDANGAPWARVFVETAYQDGDSWQMVFSHELDEMLVDPQLDQWRGGRRVEICDPVEDKRWSYWRRSATGAPVMLSDFVTPAWYRAKAHGRMDFHDYVKRPLTVLWGGYAP